VSQELLATQHLANGLTPVTGSHNYCWLLSYCAMLGTALVDFASALQGSSMG